MESRTFLKSKPVVHHQHKLYFHSRTLYLGCGALFIVIVVLGLLAHHTTWFLGETVVVHIHLETGPVRCEQQMVLSHQG